MLSVRIRSPAPCLALCSSSATDSLALEFVPARDAAVVDDRLRAVGIVKRQHRRLCEHVGRAQTRGMIGVALDLGRPGHVAFHQNAGGDAAERHGRRVEKRFAGQDFLGLANVGKDFLGRKLRASRQTGECRRCRHDLQNFAAVELGVRFVGAVRKLVFHVLLNSGVAASSSRLRQNRGALSDDADGPQRPCSIGAGAAWSSGFSRSQRDLDPFSWPANID